MPTARSRASVRAADRDHAHPAFTLVEMIVVIGIIALLIAILVPALSGAGNAASKTTTAALVREVVAACETFRVDTRRAPGYFGQREMASAENANIGFTQMENALLELAVKPVPYAQWTSAGAEQPDPTNNTWIEVGPGTNPQTRVRVDTSKFAAEGGPQYLSLRADVLQPYALQKFGAAGGETEELKFPDVLDSFGTALVMWTRDAGGPQEIRSINDFARIGFDAADQRSNFYWRSNAGVFDSGEQKARSQLGSDTAEGIRAGNLTAALGSPAFPRKDNLSLPSVPRGSIVISSAGRDKVFLARKQTSGGASAGRLGYGPQGYAPSDNAPSGSAERGPTPDTFDDIFEAVGN